LAGITFLAGIAAYLLAFLKVCMPIISRAANAG
jgi:hypothetical protein